MISHKGYFLATRPKIQTLTPKLLTHQLIVSYRVNCKPVNWNLVNIFLFLYIIIIIIIINLLYLPIYLF